MEAARWSSPISLMNASDSMHDSSKMSAESDSIIFTGVEGLSCHHFIRAVREQALAAGKQRDVQWMADYASVRFDGEALKWFESLEDETQSDWKLLRRAILTRYTEPVYEESADRRENGELEREREMSELVFTGKDKDECRRFVRTIRLRATAEGKIDDSSWMCKVAYPCFAEDALEWHSCLPRDVRSDWPRLERAILVDFPRQVSTILTPGRIHIDNWWTAVSPSSSLLSLRSREQWLNQARERRRMYIEAGDKSIPCWFLVENGADIPNNAVRTGTGTGGKPRYSARSWHGDLGLAVGKCGAEHSGALFPLAGKVISGVTPFEVLVGDPSHFHLVNIPENWSKDRTALTNRPFYAVEAGLESRQTMTFISQIYHEGHLRPGKAFSGGVSYTCVNEKETKQGTLRVLAWRD